ncbi:hypothetical protein UlMin_026688 [Ulmus minor]
MFESHDKESLAFMAKILSSSRQSEETYLPPTLHYIPPKTHRRESIKEFQMSLFPIMDDLLAKTNLSAQDIDIIIVNCSAFCPSPSLSSIIINKYSMRSDIKSYNLSGMGCSASALGVDLAQNLLKLYRNSYAISYNLSGIGCSASALSVDLAQNLRKLYRNSYAVILSTEILSSGWYSGNERPKLLLNCLFKMGSAAILLTSKNEANKCSKYELVRTLRTQRAFEDKAYLSAIREKDEKGKLGVTLKRDLLQVAGETLRSNITLLGSSILPFSEKFRYFVSIIRKRLMDKSAEIYVPDFKIVIQHFCLPTSGKPVIKEIAKGLKLGEIDMEAALMTLHRFGNQSSSSLWYELAYMEGKDRVKKGDKVWLLGMGSGPNPIVGESNKSPWADSIHQYPIVSIH